jgi:energy-coupling factor transport system permease protein
MSARPKRVRSIGHDRIPRTLHPVAWWVWALGLATASSRTTNPILLLLVLAVLAFVVANRRGEAPWARAFKYYLFLALTVVAIRVVFRIVFGGDVDSDDMRVMFTLPHIPLPSWAAGVQIGGPVTVEGTVGALYDGLRLGCLLCCIGAANTLANPKRALRILPGALYELGAAVAVALSIAPQLVESVQRVRRARRLRGVAGGKFHALRGVAIPVLEDALDRSLKLAASMDSRGYGRTSGATHRDRRITGSLMISGMCGLCVGAYGLLNGSEVAALGFPALIGGSVLCAVGLALGGRRVSRTQYRPDPWKLAEWMVVVTGLVPAVVFLTGAGSDALSLNPSVTPLMWPTLPTLSGLAILFAALAGLVAPPPERPALLASRTMRADDERGRRTPISDSSPPVEVSA